MKRLLVNLQIASSAILANKLRASLTALGIIFGVAAVIAMLAIGNGAQQEILEQIKLVGVNNIIINAVVEQKDKKEDKGNDKQAKPKTSPGLTLADVKNIREHIPNIKAVSPEVMIETQIIKDGTQRKTKLLGVESVYFDISNFKLEKGVFFNDLHLEQSASVCIIGSAIKTKFFSKEEPIGKSIKVGQHWLKIIGVLEAKNITASSMSNLGIRDYNFDVYAPVRTVLLKYVNRNLVTKASIQQAANEAQQNSENGGGNNKEVKVKNYHQLDKIVVQITETDFLTPTSEIIARMLQRRHLNVIDYEISMPEMLLKQQQSTKQIFNWVLFAIACISLLVGGIGIMNIMLASVLERIKEIGLRLSLGAKKTDIVSQFMLEAMLISVTGGIIGIVLGVSLAIMISTIAGIPTIISASSVIISFVVSASVGLVFGIAPAQRAAKQDPITSLRYE
ncbi:MAG: FtsX-like permease family protein [Cytophagia bacterium]|nr:MAG: FtsX-like permease family protein [Cytophagales bacterium]TAG06485.1 MAG: FtsX-like permease family protein [Cytophagia bacterium]TAG44255.1 MAG: FtsX-like permease family protein [Cytophagia bacterium]TAH30965.1 MAG: FtsX-like permease family protein [Cytophagales bacterium]